MWVCAKGKTMSDLRERLAVAIQHVRDYHGDMAITQVLPMILPLIEAELATTRRDWLDSFRDAVTKCARERGVENVYVFLNEYLPADLTGKASEHDKEIYDKGFEDGINANGLDEVFCTKHLAIVQSRAQKDEWTCPVCGEQKEHDAKIRRKAYQDAAKTICSNCDNGIPYDETGHHEGERNCYAWHIRKRANEADGGGK
jgi:hypothetical protein